MASHSTSPVVGLDAGPKSAVRRWFDATAHQYPFLTLVGVILVSNIAGSFFNFLYNTRLIVQFLTAPQKDAFWHRAAPAYNLFAYPLCIGVLVFLIWPLVRCRRRLRNDEPLSPEEWQFCRRRLINLPVAQLIINPLGWLPGLFIFPLVILWADDGDNAITVWGQFIVSFGVSTVFTTVQTFFVLQAYLTNYLYPEFLKNTRPESVPGVIAIPFTVRLVMLWAAVALMPLFALLAVAFNFPRKPEDVVTFYWFAAGLLIVSGLSGGAIFWLVGLDLWRWIQLQTRATAEIAQGNYDVRIDHPRPDEWGTLSSHFNDMAIALSRAWESHETLGQLVSPEVRDEILQRIPGFEVQVQEITVLFVDIRGFTARCSGESPQRVGALLNSFLTLALRSIEEQGGYVNKFLGDGVMALFGATHPQADHADLAIGCAREMLGRLRDFNTDLASQGQAPLVIGIGIHTGDALVGCFGAVLHGNNGQPVMRREFTAIGETVNLCQRIEQLTKKCGGPILISDVTRQRLRADWPLCCLGAQELPGAPAPMIVYRVVTE